MVENGVKVVGLTGKSNNKGVNWKIISAIVGIIVLAIGVIAGIILVRQNQDIRESAKECSLGGHACPDPNNPNLLRDCSTGEEFPNDSLCNSAGRVEICGATSATAKQYCCPAPGAAWTTNLSLCDVNPTSTATSTATASSTSTSTSTATSTSTSTATSVATSTSTSKATATSTSSSTTKTATPTASTTASGSTASPVPVPETGTSWVTILGAGSGLIMILLALGLAL